jgi:hypothetical protein
MARALFDAAALEGGTVAVAGLEAKVGHLEATVGQMAASLANLIQYLQRQQPGE